MWLAVDVVTISYSDRLRALPVMDLSNMYWICDLIKVSLIYENESKKSPFDVLFRDIVYTRSGTSFTLFYEHFSLN